jgi:type II secretory pathway pseudopilin PulG
MRRIFVLFILIVTLTGCSVFRGSSSKATVAEQQKTVDAIRDIGTAIEAYKLVAGKYPVASSGHVEEIEDHLVPKYLAAFPEKDGWGNELEYYCVQPEGPYYIISLGSDKERDVGLYKSNRLPSGLGFNVIRTFKEDIIFTNGEFVRYPEGLNVASSK